VGRSLFPHGAAAARRPAVSEHVIDEAADAKTGVWEPTAYVRSLRDGRMKLVRRFERGASVDALFDLDADPGESRDLSKDPGRASALAELARVSDRYDDLARALRRSGPSAGLDAETLEELRTLGYVK